MRIEKYATVSMTRTELEMAFKRYLGVPDDAIVTGLWVKDEHLAEPQKVCGFTYKISTEEHVSGK